MADADAGTDANASQEGTSPEEFEVDVRRGSRGWHLEHCLLGSGSVVTASVALTEVASSCGCRGAVRDMAASAQQWLRASTGLLERVEALLAGALELEFWEALSEVDWLVADGTNGTSVPTPAAQEVLVRARDVLDQGRRAGRGDGARALVEALGGTMQGPLVLAVRREDGHAVGSSTSLAWAAWSPTKVLEVLVLPRGALGGELSAAFEEVHEAGPDWEQVLEVADTLYAGAHEGDPCFTARGALEAAEALEA